MRRLVAVTFFFAGILGPMWVSAQPLPVDVEGFVGFAASPGVDSFLAPQLDYRTIATYGVGVNLRWTTQFSTDISVSSAKPGLRILDASIFGGFQAPGTVRTTPLALIVQWHFLGVHAIDPYVGVGAAWVFASDASLYPFVLDGTNVSGVDVEDRIAFVADAGVRFKLFGPVGFLIDARYMPVKLDATVLHGNGDPPLELNLRADQFLVGLGFSVRF
jgi:outer membrane protein W